MDRSEARSLIRASISRGSSTPTLGGVGRAEYIHAKAAELEAALIDPVSATIKGEAHHHGLLQVLAEHECLVLARSEDHYLALIPSTGEFFLAYGPHPSQLNALGFYSDDALAEWLG